MNTLNEAYSSLSTRRRYEVWFLRLALAGGGGAWWFRYLLMNPGRGGCSPKSEEMPVQVWATWFPPGGPPETFIQGFSTQDFEMSQPGTGPFRFRVGDNEIGEDFCRGNLILRGHHITWRLRYASTFRVTLSNKGWIGFSRTPHSDATFSGQISIDGKCFEGAPLGHGLQGHNCGYRHRSLWNWMHAAFPRPDGTVSTLEAIVYDMPLGLVFRKAVLWHEGRSYIFRKFRETSAGIDPFRWRFSCEDRGLRLEAQIDGTGCSVHKLPYVKTDCSGTFEVVNNSLSAATVNLIRNGVVEKLDTNSGAVLEIGGGR